MNKTEEKEETRRKGKSTYTVQYMYDEEIRKTEGLSNEYRKTNRKKRENVYRRTVDKDRRTRRKEGKR